MKTLVFTGGHHTSALPVALGLQKEGWTIVWFGHRHSLWRQAADSAEYREVISHGIKFHDLKAGKFYRTFNPLKLVKLPTGFIQAIFLLAKIRPKGIVSFGGYLAVPTIIGAWLLGIPSITHEQTVTAGWANKLVSLFVQKIAISWPDSSTHFPKSKTILTGLPLRPGILQKKSPRPQVPPLIYVTGGKNGSQVINKVVFSSLPVLLRNYRVIHQTGFKDIVIARKVNQKNYEAFDFDSQRGANALISASVVICRGGAHTVYELGYLGKKSVIIPIPSSSHQEQLLNARILAKNNLSVILPQEHLSVDSLLNAIKNCQKLSGTPLDLPTDGTQKMIRLINQTFS